jgi:hypothetical protein
LKKEKSLYIGFALIAIGALFLFVNISFFNGIWSLGFMSLACLIAYFILGGSAQPMNVSFLLSALIMLMISFFVLFKNIEFLSHDGYLLIFLSLAFFVTFFIHKSHVHAPPLWSLFIGMILLFTGISWLIPYSVWAIFFILLGIFIIIKQK